MVYDHRSTFNLLLNTMVGLSHEDVKSVFLLYCSSKFVCKFIDHCLIFNLFLSGVKANDNRTIQGFVKDYVDEYVGEYSLDAFIRVTVLRASVYKNKKVCHKSL